MSSLRTFIRAAISADLEKVSDFANGKQKIPFHREIELASGTGENAADTIFSDRRQIAASGDEDLDLAGSLENALGEPAVFVAVKAILVRADAGNAHDLVVGPSDENGFTGPFGDASDRISVPPGGAFLVVAPIDGWSVTAATGDLLNVANGGAVSAVDYDIIVVGTSA